MKLAQHRGVGTIVMGASRQGWDDLLERGNGGQGINDRSMMSGTSKNNNNAALIQFSSSHPYSVERDIGSGCM